MTITLYLLGAAYTAAALIVYAHRHAQLEHRPGLGINSIGYILIGVVAVGWFLLVPVALALHILDIHGYVHASLARFRRPAQGKPDTARHAATPPGGTVKISAARELTERHAALKVAPLATDPPNLDDEPAAEGEPPACPACREDIPTFDGRFIRHHRAFGDNERYCPGSHAVVRKPR